MNKFRTKKWVALTLVFFQLVIGGFSGAPRFALAQTADVDPPIIEFDGIASGNVSDSQVFAATVVDNVEVQSVKLFYRFDESTEYSSRTMGLLGDSGIYTVKLESAELPDQANLIQYYLEATDTVGNKALQGFAFDPLERLLVSESVAAVSTASEPFVAGSLTLTRKVIYGAVGLLLVGVLAAASGSSGSSVSAGVPVTVVVDQLP